MIPLRDANPTQRLPVVTILLIVSNVAVFLIELLAEAQGSLGPFIDRWAVIPAELSSQPLAELPTVFSSMFLHGGWAHLLGNMLFLWIFGDNIEDRLGSARYLLLYLIAGTVAVFAQWLTGPQSLLPMIGASGAISGVLGAYLVEFPRARVTTLIFYFVVQVPAILVLGGWFVIQFFQGVASLGAAGTEMGGVAFFAHVGGFVAGVLLIKPLALGRPPGRRRRLDWD